LLLIKLKLERLEAAAATGTSVLFCHVKAPKNVFNGFGVVIIFDPSQYR
jgi:hypothetical protein